MRKWKSRILIYIFFIMAFLWVILPLYWTFTTAISRFADMSESVIIPPRPVLDNFESVILGREVIQESSGSSVTGASSSTVIAPLISSIIVAFGTAGITVILSIFAAYSHARMSYPGKPFSFVLLFFPRIIPVMIMALPFFILFMMFGLTNTHLGLILVHSVITLPLATWILRDFLDGIPVDLEEAAMVDGASRLQAIFRIVVPLLVPGLIAIATYAFMTSWGEFFFALVLTDNLTLPPFIISFRSPQKLEYGGLAAGVILASIPPFLLSSLLQKYLTRAIVTGGVKR